MKLMEFIKALGNKSNGIPEKICQNHYAIVYYLSDYEIISSNSGGKVWGDCSVSMIDSNSVKVDDKNKTICISLF